MPFTRLFRAVIAWLRNLNRGRLDLDPRADANRPLYFSTPGLPHLKV
ncbi:MAG: hypothetical protein JO101_01745 [Candidatus Eremiobacteraeota bacterium]|nr:hypothetical protein [Candidatus Eremiobacteraeota bacterium]MBV8354016.1 hypothetical protein [Candidatus Eremiobacteraeota bacterium]